MAEQRHALPASIRNGPKYLSEQDQRAFLRKFQDQNGDRRQLSHTTMELIVGVFGATIGFTPQYEPKMNAQTPDWLFLDLEAKPRLFGDVLNFHMNADIEKEMDADVYWSGDLPDSRVRLYSSLKEKTAKYKELADGVNLPFFVFLYGSFDAFLHPMELESCLRNREWGLFKDYPQLSGVYHFDDARTINGEYLEPGYSFRFYANPHATRPLTLGEGLVPSQFRTRLVY